VNKDSLRVEPGEGPVPDPVDVGIRSPTLGGALRRAWVGYQQLLDTEMAKAGFADRSFPDGRVLRLCAREESVTASRIGRELGITRQGAGKIVKSLRDRGYVTLGPPSGDGREKALVLTDRAHDYLTAQRAAARRIENTAREQIGDEAFTALAALLALLGVDEQQPRLREYLGCADRLGVDR
jgi:DNA-binding MarR family transcriptional regulator